MRKNRPGIKMLEFFLFIYVLGVILGAFAGYFFCIVTSG